MAVSGQLVGGRYRLDDRIASGGMGEVWQATDTSLGRTVAVKLLHRHHAEEAEFQERFRNEALMMAALRHPNIAEVYDYGETDDSAFIVMARIDGRPLDELIAEAGRLDAVTSLTVIADAARALDAAHRAGIVHRDVKPANLVITSDGSAVLVDFGVARSGNSTALTDAYEVVGTALYMAPEQISKRPTGPAADVYALGAVAHHCLTGRPPFLGTNPIQVAMSHVNDEPPQLPDDTPDPVRDFVATAMAKDPADRFPDAAAMARAADAIADHLTTGATIAVPVAHVPRRRSAHTAVVVLGVLAVVVLCVLVSLLTPTPSSPAAAPYRPPPGAAAPGPDPDPKGGSGSTVAAVPGTAPVRPDSAAGVGARTPAGRASVRPAAPGSGPTPHQATDRPTARGKGAQAHRQPAGGASPPRRRADAPGSATVAPSPGTGTPGHRRP
jgi:serine/threonine-protein kinase